MLFLTPNPQYQSTEGNITCSTAIQKHVYGLSPLGADVWFRGLISQKVSC